MSRDTFNALFGYSHKPLPRNVARFKRKLDNYSKYSNNIFPPFTKAQDVVDCLRDVYLGEDWYCTDSLHTEQINTIILTEILKQHYGEFN